MKYVEIIANAGSYKTISAIANKVKAVDFRGGVIGDDGMQQMRMLVDDSRLQETLDTLQTILGAQPSVRIVVLPVYADLPKAKVEEKKENVSASIIRESLYQDIERGARLDSNYLLLVILATTVAAIGLIENNVAVVIGAMVIAPLLGPNLALSLGTSLGDGDLMLNSIKTLSVGIIIAIGMSVWIGLLWPGQFDNHEIMSRTNASLDSIALALASGAAATLSLTTGLSGVLVGVMVAVALLPPAVTMGIMIGSGQMHLASGAGLLLAINIVCVNLASKVVFLFKGVSPRTWIEKKKANKAMRRYILGWVSTLTALLAFIFFKGY
ncbi:TIGR00341 family protein [Microbulbifer sp. THAF38]|uniref:TIGR00341 family protein n=1 Tax=unclassified Microbulbifer TaxID=2619833 RepID=UPI001268822D|nr:TIGR00341 family protein [Microbulbifer sp. THAF38]QFT55370.1 hypothetical protein FIU95_12470 [Microbulbifer sp. THAF38]